MDTQYKIIGVCPFGNLVMDKHGRMDATQFSTDDPGAYTITTGAVLAIQVAQHYGAKPVCLIETDFGIIKVYDLCQKFGIIVEDNAGWRSTDNTVYRNTVNPVALVKAAQHIWESRNHG